jgi:CBS domain-containing protein
MKVRDILQEKGKTLITVGRHETLLTASRLLKEHRIGVLLVMGDGGQPVGILSERDIVRQLAQHGGACEDVPVEDAMTEDPIVGVPDDAVERVASIMAEQHIRHLPIIEDGELIGLVSIRDVVAGQLKKSETRIRTLQTYLDSIP